MRSRRKLAFWGVLLFDSLIALLMLHDLRAEEREVPLTIQVTPSSLAHGRELCKYARETQRKVNVPLYGAKGEFFSVPCVYVREGGEK